MTDNMQDRYTGDLGDFSKLGILRALEMAGLSIGVNWYLTPDENHNGDGRHVKYLNQEERQEESISSISFLCRPMKRYHPSFLQVRKTKVNILSWPQKRV